MKLSVLLSSSLLALSMGSLEEGSRSSTVCVIHPPFADDFDSKWYYEELQTEYRVALPPFSFGPKNMRSLPLPSPVAVPPERKIKHILRSVWFTSTMRFEAAQKRYPWRA